jgi:hypothetical protein
MTRTVSAPRRLARSIQVVIQAMCAALSVSWVMSASSQAQQPHALRFQVEAELLKAVIGWVIDMKVAELKHCVAVVCCGRNGIFKTQDSRGWLEEQCIR